MFDKDLQLVFWKKWLSFFNSWQNNFCLKISVWGFESFELSQQSSRIRGLKNQALIHL